VSGRVLITGASGLIGQLLMEGLAGDHDVLGVDVRAPRGSDIRRVDMTRLGAAERSFEGVELVIDLAANPSPAISWREACEHNVPAALNALEAARRAGVRRLVYASSNHVTGMYEHDEPYASIVAGNYEGLDPAATPLISSTHPVRPDGPYAVSKAFGEAAGRYYADAFDLSVICLRIGTVNAEGRPRNAREFATLLTHGDLVRLVDGCLRAPEDLRFGTFYGVSANRWRFWEIADAEHALGYRPRDDAEDFRAAS
jgi:nucleoside-diphosphate-sugar epimerase